MEDGTSSVWNIDAAEFFLIFQLKEKFVEQLHEWKLDDGYWTLRLLRMELDAKFKRPESRKIIQEIEEEKAKRKGDKVISEKEEVDQLMTEVDKKRAIFISLNNPNNQQKSEFYSILEGFYLHLCYLMKRHQMYFREGEDNRLAILRR